MPASSPAKATIILKVDPGAYWPAIALLVSGDSGLWANEFQVFWVSPVLKMLGS